MESAPARRDEIVGSVFAGTSMAERHRDPRRLRERPLDPQAGCPSQSRRFADAIAHDRTSPLPRRQGHGAADGRRARRCDRADPAARHRDRGASSPARDDATAVASYRLKSLTPDDYDAAIRDGARQGRRRPRRQPCGARDPAVGAASRRHRARRRRRGRRSGRSRMAADAWDGFVSGNAESEPALAGAMAADLSGYGDVRDLYTRGPQLCGRRGDRHHDGGARRGRPHAHCRHGLLARRDRTGEGRRQHGQGRQPHGPAVASRCAARCVRLAGEAVDTGALRRLGKSLGAFDFTAVARRRAASCARRPPPS